MDFFFQICSDYHLNFIYIYYCCIWLVVFCYVIMNAICVYCKFTCIRMYYSTWALGKLKTCFINEPQIDKITVYLVIFTTAL